MDTNELEAVRAVNFCGGYLEASRTTGIPVSTLSKRVSRVETELGLVIFDRKTRSNSVSLTEHGRALMPLISKLLSADSSMRRTVGMMLGGSPSALSVGRPTMLGDLGETAAVSGFLAENPEVELISVLRSHSELVRLLSEGLLECAFLAVLGGGDSVKDTWSAFASDMYDITVFSTNPHMYIGVSENDPLARRDSVSIDELRGRTLIFSKLLEHSSRVAQDRDSFLEQIKTAPDEFKIVYEDFINRDYIYSLVASGAGLLPQALASPHRVAGVRLLPLEDWKQSTSVVFVARKYGSEAQKRFAAYIKAAAEK